MLRTLCELSLTPKHEDGFFGDVMNMFLTPSHVFNRIVGEENDYIKAQKSGRVWGDCSGYYQSCPHSFFEFIDQPQINEEQSYHYHHYPNQTSHLNNVRQQFY